MYIYMYVYTWLTSNIFARVGCAVGSVARKVAMPKTQWIRLDQVWSVQSRMLPLPTPFQGTILSRFVWTRQGPIGKTWKNHGSPKIATCDSLPAFCNLFWWKGPTQSAQSWEEWHMQKDDPQGSTNWLVQHNLLIWS
jgi:hypothetical protein